MAENKKGDNEGKISVGECFVFKTAWAGKY